MKERPILFSAPMVRAILAGTKTQTRRVVKPRPMPDGGWTVAARPSGFELVHWDNDEQERRAIACPYGQPGDRLWVREAWAPHFMYEGVKPAEILIDARSCLFYAADGGITGGCVPTQRARKWRPAIHMPRAASRITLQITGVRVERLQAISESDAMAEGIVRTHGGYGLPDGSHYHASDPRQSYLGLWEAINGAGSVLANPWVWVVEFKRVEDR